MGPSALYALPLFLSLSSAPTPIQPTVPGPPRPGGYLSEEDAVYLDYLVHEFLFDPKNAIRVRVAVPARSLFGQFYGRSLDSNRTEQRDGWLVKASRGKPDRVYFTDGESIDSEFKVIKRVDYESECAQRIQGKATIDFGSNVEQILRALQSIDFNDSDLIRAAWLHRRGYDGLAARFLVIVRERNEDARQEARESLARRTYEVMCNCMGARADAEAFAHAERLFRLYPDFASEKYPQAAVIMDDLKRRKAAGTFGKAPEKDWPTDFATWDVKRKIRYLIDSLDEIAPEPKRGIFGNEWSLEGDRRFAALVEIGDSAVPALIDALEKDSRLCRSAEWHIGGISYSGFHPRTPTVIAVRDIVERVIKRILRVDNLEPHSAAEDQDKSPSAEVQLLRRYWAEHGHLRFEDRMMSILTDSAATPRARREAACQLVCSLRIERESWDRKHRRFSNPGERAESVITKRESGSVSKAMLSAMDELIARYSNLNNDEREFVVYLANLGDERVGPELAKRAGRAKEIDRRLLYCEAAFDLGYMGPMIALARELQAGSIALTQETDDRERLRAIACHSLRELLCLFVRCNLPEAQEAVYSLADADHPLHSLTVHALVNDFDSQWCRSPICGHPFMLSILRHSLQDFRMTGVHYYVRGDRVACSTDRGVDRDLILHDLTARNDYVEHAEARVADHAAVRLESVVCGIPQPHPLRPDQDKVLQQMSGFLDRYRRSIRRMSFFEARKFEMLHTDYAFIPDIRPLGRPATAADVKIGRAVFNLGGRGKAADVKLPGWLTLKTQDKDKPTSRGLIVQAETDADGKLVYGVIFRHEIRAVRADEVERIEPFEKK